MKDTNLTNTLRRSPRFLHQNQVTPRKIPTPQSFSAPLGSSVTKTHKDTKSKSVTESSKASTNLRVTRSWVGTSRSVNSLNNESNQISGKRDKKVAEMKDSEKSVKCPRRSAKLDNVSRNGEFLDSQGQDVVEKRMTRSLVRGNKGNSGEMVRFLSREGNPRVGEQIIGNIEKRVTRSSIQTKTISLSTDEKRAKNFISLKDVKDCGIEREIGDKNMQNGEKSKRFQVEEESQIVQGWTEEQESGLRRAYFTAKPTPHFWKNVARMVPGKSAKECFDRIHLDHLTPSQPRTRSRVNRKEPSPILFSASKLLSPAAMKTKKLRSRRTCLAQKTVRQLLQKQQTEDQGYEADLFAVLESTTEPSLSNEEGTGFASPTPNQGYVILTRCRETSSSAYRKQCSRLNSLRKAGFVSPPVLKQIKNKALHEKYIDQLHCRDAKRKAEALRKAKLPENKNKSHLKVNSVKVAKDALVFDAQDAINQLRRLKSSTNSGIDDDDNTSCSDEDEDEDILC